MKRSDSVAATTSVGRQAEAAVARKLQEYGYKILQRNWRTKFCEIDVVAQKNNIIYFVEVKYREQDKQGSGLEYITPRKLSQIKFATRFWCQNFNWEDDCRIYGAEVSGPDYETIDLVEID